MSDIVAWMKASQELILAPALRLEVAAVTGEHAPAKSQDASTCAAHFDQSIKGVSLLE